MGRTPWLLCLLLVIPSAGCGVASLHPLHSKDVAARDDNLVSTWVLDSDDPKAEDYGKFPLEITALGTGYWVEYQFHKNIKQERCRYSADLVKLGSAYYLDLLPSWTGTRLVDEATLLRPHQFVWVKAEKDTLTLRPVDRAKLTRLLEARKADLTWEEVDGKLVLTSKPPALQAFFRKHGESVLGEPVVLRRKAKGAAKEQGGAKK